IVIGASLGATTTITNNTLQLKSNGTNAALYGIDNAAGASGGTSIITDNKTFSDNTMGASTITTAGIMMGIINGAPFATQVFTANENTITNNSVLNQS